MNIEENLTGNYIRVEDQMAHYEPSKTFEKIVRELPRDIYDVYFNQENNKDKYQLLDVSKGEEEFDPEESLEEPTQARRHAMHRAVGVPNPIKIFKMGTIQETIEENDADKIMSSRSESKSKLNGLIR
jgi:hypothetical protein